MPIYCFVEGCSSTSYMSQHQPNNGERITFYSFPKNIEENNKWVMALSTINKQSIMAPISKSARICEKHFARENVCRFGMFSQRLAHGAVPSIFPHTAESSNHIESNNDAENDTDNSNAPVHFVDTHALSYSDETQSLTENNAVNSNASVQSVIDMSTSSYREHVHIAERQRTIRYAGDMSNDILDEMSPESLKECIKNKRYFA